MKPWQEQCADIITLLETHFPEVQYEYGYDSMYNHSITQVEHDGLLLELETASLDRCREIIGKLLKLVPVHGYAKYDPNFGCDRVCECDHPYHRHFDSYDQMSPVGCKYCRCFAFVEKGTDPEKWKKLNSEE